MRLYHFTFAADLIPIFGWRLLDDKGPRVAEGIKPNADPDDPLANGAPVVWLTSRPSLMPTPADLDWTNSPACLMDPDRLSDFRKHGSIGDRTMMLDVDLSPNSKRLRHIEAFCPPWAFEMLSPSAREEWWAYFGTISDDRIVGIVRTMAPPRNESEALIIAAIHEQLTGGAVAAE